ncbi:lysylphosphatidylglycerol synthase transmembrane domain-containing protein [Plantibacter sp. CFBP 8804]|uniref:lysylphosphatidylglycerol synthase transmembrane domain-containing protein n=1 Tax=Plantibacter sp. CFBP 8804 TaxID=2775270 RepID=UPI00177F8E52|nr:lysylphosphatidylglycerol synthase transmembrane domain-containing protein [Plantibacter sp. CFBP 8804]MBD8516574.1 flippase-like domain-containing protein [Plantibacter sp. CFBP 8804]
MKILTKYRKPIQVGFAVVVIACIAWTVVANWASFSASVSQMDPLWIVASGAAGFTGVALSMLAWRAIVIAFGHRISVRDAGYVVFVSQIGKYIPGGVWPIVAGSQLGRRAGLPTATTVVTLTAQLGVSLVTGSTLAVGALFGFPALREYAWVLVVLVVIGVVALLPPVMRRVLGWMFTVMKRRDELPELRTLPLLSAVGWSLASWAAFGLHLWCIVSALGTVDVAAILPAICGYALAWVVGFLAVIAPAGAGVREAILALVLANTVTASSILGIVLVSRFVLIVVDVAVCGYAVVRGHVRVVAVDPQPPGSRSAHSTQEPDPR